MYYFKDIEFGDKTIRNIFYFIGEHSVVTFPDIESNDGPERTAYLEWLAEGNTPEPWNPEEQ